MQSCCLLLHNVIKARLVIRNISRGALSECPNLTETTSNTSSGNLLPSEQVKEESLSSPSEEELEKQLALRLKSFRFTRKAPLRRNKNKHIVVDDNNEFTPIIQSKYPVMEHVAASALTLSSRDTSVFSSNVYNSFSSPVVTDIGKQDEECKLTSRSTSLESSTPYSVIPFDIFECNNKHAWMDAKAGYCYLCQEPLGTSVNVHLSDRDHMAMQFFLSLFASYPRGDYTQAHRAFTGLKRQNSKNEKDDSDNKNNTTEKKAVPDVYISTNNFLRRKEVSSNSSSNNNIRLSKMECKRLPEESKWGEREEEEEKIDNEYYEKNDNTVLPERALKETIERNLQNNDEVLTEELLEHEREQSESELQEEEYLEQQEEEEEKEHVSRRRRVVLQQVNNSSQTREKCKQLLHNVVSSSARMTFPTSPHQKPNELRASLLKGSRWHYHHVIYDAYKLTPSLYKYATTSVQMDHLHIMDDALRRAEIEALLLFLSQPPHKALSHVLQGQSPANFWVAGERLWKWHITRHVAQMYPAGSAGLMTSFTQKC